MDVKERDASPVVLNDSTYLCMYVMHDMPCTYVQCVNMIHEQAPQAALGVPVHHVVHTVPELGCRSMDQRSRH